MSTKLRSSQPRVGLSVPEKMALFFVKRFVIAVALIAIWWVSPTFNAYAPETIAEANWIVTSWIVIGSMCLFFADLDRARVQVKLEAALLREEVHDKDAHDQQNEIYQAWRERNQAVEDHERALCLLNEEKTRAAERHTLYFRERETARSALAEALAEARTRDSVIANRDAEIASLLKRFEMLNKLGPAFTDALTRAAQEGPVKLADVIATLTSAADEAELCASVEAKHGPHDDEIRGTMIAVAAVSIAMAVQLDRQQPSKNPAPMGAPAAKS